MSWQSETRLMYQVLNLVKRAIYSKFIDKQVNWYIKWPTNQWSLIGHVNSGIIFLCWKFPMSLYNTQSKSDWLFNTQSRILQADWLSVENNEKATLNINMPYCRGNPRTQHYLLYSSRSTSPLQNSDIFYYSKFGIFHDKCFSSGWWFHSTFKRNKCTKSLPP